MKKIFLISLVIIIVSCTNHNRNDLNPHETKLVVIDPSKQEIMGDSEYDIIDVIPLNLPKDVATIMAKDIQMVNNRIYILDAEANKTVFLFGMDGKPICLWIRSINFL